MYTINDSNKKEAVAIAIVHREREVFSYDLNISNYEAMLASLPQGEWPANLAQYKNSTLDQVPDDLDQAVSEYQYRDRIRYLIKTERAERAKSWHVYQALLNQIPEAERADAIAAAVAKLALASN